jgi:hypothetical protein
VDVSTTLCKIEPLMLNDQCLAAEINSLTFLFYKIGDHPCRSYDAFLCY